MWLAPALEESASKMKSLREHVVQLLHSAVNLPGQWGSGHLGWRIGLSWPLRVSLGGLCLSRATDTTRVAPLGVRSGDPPRGLVGRLNAPKVFGAALSQGRLRTHLPGYDKKT